MSKRPRVTTVAEMMAEPQQPEAPFPQLPCTLLTFVPIPVKVLCGGLTGISNFPLTTSNNVTAGEKALSFDYEGTRIHVGWANVAAMTHPIESVRPLGV